VTSLPEGLAKEQKRVRGVLKQYIEIGSPGTIGASLIEIKLQQVDEAIASGDPIEMLRAYEDLKEIE